MKEKELDYARLRELNIPEEVIRNMAIQDGGNIDEEGNVLFLDEARQKSKENQEKPMWTNKSDGIGIQNAFVNKVSEIILTQLRTGKGSREQFDMLVEMANAPASSLKHKATMKLLGMDKKGYTHGVIFPLNIDLADSAVSCVMPIDLVMASIEDAEYIAIVDMCLCRVSYDCQDYPQDFGCIFLNKAGKRVVEAGVAHHVTLEDAKAHVLKAKELGLFAASEFLQGEQYIWGIPNSEMNEFRMICFCCPCCCLMMKILKAGTLEEKKRYVSCGYTSTVNHNKCVGCQKCAQVCPQKAITYRKDRKAVINQDKCMGCGYCKMECASNAISLKQTYPLRTSVNEYFLKEARIDDEYIHKKINC